jgi:hypothetical protein
MRTNIRPAPAGRRVPIFWLLCFRPKLGLSERTNEAPQLANERNPEERRKP